MTRSVEAPCAGTVVAIERLRAGRATTVEITGTSMEPLLRAGQRVHIDPCSAGDLRIGDLVAFERGQAIVLHRVLARDRATGDITEKGDNADRATRIPQDRILGRATRQENPERSLRTSPWLARLSRLHDRLHATVGRAAARYPRSRLSLVLRFLDALFRALRRIVAMH